MRPAGAYVFGFERGVRVSVRVAGLDYTHAFIRTHTYTEMYENNNNINNNNNDQI